MEHLHQSMYNLWGRLELFLYNHCQKTLFKNCLLEILEGAHSLFVGFVVIIVLFVCFVCFPPGIYFCDKQLLFLLPPPPPPIPPPPLSPRPSLSYPLLAVPL